MWSVQHLPDYSGGMPWWVAAVTSFLYKKYCTPDPPNVLWFKYSPLRTRNLPEIVKKNHESGDLSTMREKSFLRLWESNMGGRPSSPNRLTTKLRPLVKDQTEIGIYVLMGKCRLSKSVRERRCFLKILYILLNYLLLNNISRIESNIRRPKKPVDRPRLKVNPSSPETLPILTKKILTFPLLYYV